jgi:hypothetical protein
MIKVSNNLVKLANTAICAQHDFAAQYKEASVRDYLASFAPVVTGLGGGFAGLHASDGSVPVAVLSSILGSLGGIPLMYLLSSEAQKKKYRKNPETAIGSFGLVF